MEEREALDKYPMDPDPPRDPLILSILNSWLRVPVIPIIALTRTNDPLL